MDKAAHKAWANDLAALVERWPKVTLKKMMGSYAIMVHGSMFAFPWQGGANIKLPPETAKRLVAAGHAKPFEMNGRRMGGWFAMPGGSAAEKKRLVRALEEARDYVEAHPTEKKRRAKMAKETL